MAILLAACGNGSDGNNSAAPTQHAADAPSVNDTLAAPLALSQQPFGSLTLIDEIDTATAVPADQYPSGASTVGTVLGQSARKLPPVSTASYMTYRVGQGKGLVAKAAYVLDIEYPDDVSRSMFIANRGADMLRGIATGSAIGDARKAFTISTLESLAYPQTGSWQHLRSLFFLHERFTAKAQRDASCSTRPLLPADGFDVSIFQTRQVNDPRSNGAAVGKIRLYRVDDEAALAATINYPGSLPRRHIFWREEMADEAVSNSAAAKRAVTNAIDWFTFKMDMGRALGFNAVGKDLMEWGWNQGFDGGDSNWIYSAQPPLSNIWPQIVAAATARNLYLVPYLEYGGSLGGNCSPGQACDKTAGNYKSLGFQSRTRKLFYGLHGPSITGTADDAYTTIWWTEGKSADLTDPDTTTDLQKVLDKVMLPYKSSASFAGVWLRMRQSKLPISFSADTLARYNADNPLDTRTLAQLQTDVSSRQAYADWWYGKRRAFLRTIRNYMRTSMADTGLQTLFTAYNTEPVPPAYTTNTATSLLSLVTDDASWWSSYTATLDSTTDPKSWYRYNWGSRTLSNATTQRLHKIGLEKTWVPAEDPWSHDWQELTHGTPPADPQRYTAEDGIAMTYEFGSALYTVGDADLLASYANASGSSVTHHFPLNEDNGNVYSDSSCSETKRYAITDDQPFDGKLGYVAVAVERAGPFSVIAEARALANGNPINLAYLESSSMSRSSPAYVRRFNQALLSLPAVAVTATSGMSSDSSVVVRQYATAAGNYYAVINPSLTVVSGVVIDFGANSSTSVSSVQDLIANSSYDARKLSFDLYPGEVRTFKTP